MATNRVISGNIWTTSLIKCVYLHRVWFIVIDVGCLCTFVYLCTLTAMMLICFFGGGLILNKAVWEFSKFLKHLGYIFSGFNFRQIFLHIKGSFVFQHFLFSAFSFIPEACSHSVVLPFHHFYLVFLSWFFSGSKIAFSCSYCCIMTH